MKYKYIWVWDCSLRTARKKHCCFSMGRFPLCPLFSSRPPSSWPSHPPRTCSPSGAPQLPALTSSAVPRSWHPPCFFRIRPCTPVPPSCLPASSSGSLLPYNGNCSLHWAPSPQALTVLKSLQMYKSPPRNYFPRLAFFSSFNLSKSSFLGLDYFISLYSLIYPVQISIPWIEPRSLHNYQVLESSGLLIFSLFLLTYSSWLRSSRFCHTVLSPSSRHFLQCHKYYNAPRLLSPPLLSLIISTLPLTSSSSFRAGILTDILYSFSPDHFPGLQLLYTAPTGCPSVFSNSVCLKVEFLTLYSKPLTASPLAHLHQCDTSVNHLTYVKTWKLPKMTSLPPSLSLPLLFIPS